MGAGPLGGGYGVLGDVGVEGRDLYGTLSCVFASLPSKSLTKRCELQTTSIWPLYLLDLPRLAIYLVCQTPSLFSEQI